MHASRIKRKYSISYVRLAVLMLIIFLMLAGIFVVSSKPEVFHADMPSHPSFLRTVLLFPGDTAGTPEGSLPESLSVRKKVLYSSNDKVATVDLDGKIQANELGKATIHYVDLNLRITICNVIVIEKKTIYLTFDDGPSAAITPLILDILDRYRIKATFFVVGQYVNYYPQLVEEIVARGHSIGIHSNTHNYDTIYLSSSSLHKDFDELERKLMRITGEKPSLYRFPGGSYEAWNHLGSTGYEDFLIMLHGEGYRGFDWSCSLGDTSPKLNSPEALYKSALKRFKSGKHVVFLAHDMGGKENTPEAINLLIRHFLADGYVFDVLDHYPGELLYY